MKEKRKISMQIQIAREK